jgi:hypothetical protein
LTGTHFPGLQKRGLGLHILDGGREGVLRTVEFKAVSEDSVASTKGRGTPTMNLEDALLRGVDFTEY